MQQNTLNTKDLGSIHDRFNVPELINEFRRSGVVTLREWLSTEQLLDLRCHAAPHFDRTSSKGRFPGILKNLQNNDAWFHTSISEGAQVDLIEMLLGIQVVPASAAVFIKRPEEGTNRIHPHRDSLGLNSGVHGATIWIAIDRVDESNGSVQFLKGSHLKTMEITPENREHIYQAELEPGDATVHSSNILHWSDGNSSSSFRRGVSYFYWTKESASKKKGFKSYL